MGSVKVIPGKMFSVTGFIIITQLCVPIPRQWSGSPCQHSVFCLFSCPCLPSCFPMNPSLGVHSNQHRRSGLHSGLPCGSDGKESACKAGDQGSIPGLGRSPGEGNGNPLRYSCLESPHGQRSLESYSPWGGKEWDMTDRLHTHTHTHTHSTSGWKEIIHVGKLPVASVVVLTLQHPPPPVPAPGPGRGDTPPQSRAWNGKAAPRVLCAAGS